MAAICTLKMTLALAFTQQLTQLLRTHCSQQQHVHIPCMQHKVTYICKQHMGIVLPAMLVKRLIQLHISLHACTLELYCCAQLLTAMLVLWPNDFHTHTMMKATAQTPACCWAALLACYQTLLPPLPPQKPRPPLSSDCSKPQARATSPGTFRQAQLQGIRSLQQHGKPKHRLKCRRWCQ